MKLRIAVLAGLLAMGSVQAQVAENCILLTEIELGGSKEDVTLAVTPIVDLDSWLTHPAIFVHEEYRGRGSCIDDALDCWVRDHDVLWFEGNDQTILLSRKRGDLPGLLEAHLEMERDPDGRFLKGEVKDADGNSVRKIFVLPFGKKTCPMDWYTPADAECRYFRIEVFNTGLDPRDEEPNQQLPDELSNWKGCEALEEPAELTGSAHEPPPRP